MTSEPLALFCTCLRPQSTRRTARYLSQPPKNLTTLQEFLFLWRHTCLSPQLNHMAVNCERADLTVCRWLTVQINESSVCIRNGCIRLLRSSDHRRVKCALLVFQESNERYLVLFPHTLLILSASLRMSGFIYQVCLQYMRLIWN